MPAKTENQSKPLHFDVDLPRQLRGHFYSEMELNNTFQREKGYSLHLGQTDQIDHDLDHPDPGLPL